MREGGRGKRERSTLEGKAGRQAGRKAGKKLGSQEARKVGRLLAFQKIKKTSLSTVILKPTKGRKDRRRERSTEMKYGRKDERKEVSK